MSDPTPQRLFYLQAWLSVLFIYVTERGSWAECWVKWAMRQADDDLRRMIGL